MKYVYIKAYVWNNLGDDLFIKKLCNKYSDCSFIIKINDKKNIKPFKEIENLKCFKPSKPITFFCKIIEHLFYFNFIDFFLSFFSFRTVLIGGSMFQESTNWKKKYFLLKRSFILSKLHIIGVNFGPYSSNEYLIKYKKLFCKVSDVCMRDKYSYNQFKELDNVRFASDIIFSIGKNNNCINNGSVVISVINIDENDHCNLLDFNNSYRKFLKNIVDYHLEAKEEVILMSFCEAEGDMKIAQEIKNGYKNELLKIYDYCGDTSEALNILSSSNVIYGSRFHSIVLGLLYGKKVIPIIYNKKQNYLLEDILFTNTIIPIDQYIGEFNDFGNLNLEETYVIDNSIIDNSIGHFKSLDKWLKK